MIVLFVSHLLAEICFFMVGEVLCALAFGVGIFLGPTKGEKSCEILMKRSPNLMVENH